VIDSMRILEHNKPAVEYQASEKLLMMKGLFGRAAGI
jgi:hypothetical protein